MTLQLTRRVWATVAGLTLLHLGLGLWLAPDGMFFKYPDAAKLLNAGNLPTHLGADYSPLYLMLHTFFSPMVLRVGQALAGASAIVATFLLGHRLFGVAAGLFAAGLLSLSQTWLLYEATFEPDLLIAVLNVWALWGLVSRNEKLPVWTAFLLGAAIALRPNNALFVAIVLVFSLVAAFRTQFWLRLRQLAWWVLVVLAAAVFPLGWKQARLPGEASATMSVGAVMHMGNRPESTGLGAQPSRLIKMIELQERAQRPPDYAHELYRQFARSEAGETASAFEAEVFWLKKVWAFASTYPGAFLRMWSRKAVTFAVGPDGHDVGEVMLKAHEWAHLPLIPSHLLGVVGVMGFFFFLFQRKAGLVLAFLGTLLTSVLLFYVVARYRLVALPAFSVLGAGFLLGPFEKTLKKNAWVWAGVSLSVLAIVVSASFLQDMRVMLERAQKAAPLAMRLQQSLRERNGKDAESAWVSLQAVSPLSHLTRNVGNLLWNSSAMAQESLNTALENEGDSAADLYLLGVLGLRAEKWKVAEEAFTASALTGFTSAVFDWALDSRLELARMKCRQGFHSEALRWVQEVKAQRPGMLDGMALETAIRTALGMNVQDVEAPLFRLHDSLTANLALAQAHNEAGNFSQALKAAEAVLSQRPEAAVVWFEKGRALKGLGRLQEAALGFSTAQKLFPGHAFDF